MASTDISDKALLRFIVKLGIPAIKAHRRWIENIVAAHGISPLEAIRRESGLLPAHRRAAGLAAIEMLLLQAREQGDGKRLA